MRGLSVDDIRYLRDFVYDHLLDSDELEEQVQAIRENEEMDPETKMVCIQEMADEQKQFRDLIERMDKVLKQN